MKSLAFILWSWGTTVVFAGIIYWMATLPFVSSTSAGDEVIKTAFRMLMYAVFFLLLYRSFIATLRNTVSRLSAWRSKGEAVEDAEFVLIIETLIVIVCVLSTTLFSIFEEMVQVNQAGRTADLKDILVSIMAVLLTALVVYTMPAVGELEVAIAQKLKKEREFVKSKFRKNKQ
jgi:hypothetical protein